MVSVCPRLYHETLTNSNSSPELLLNSDLYSLPIDMWSVGCIFGELLLSRPLFPGQTEIQQMSHISTLLGAPNASIWPEYPKFKVKWPGETVSTFEEVFYDRVESIAFLKQFLVYDPTKRLTAKQALRDRYFQDYPRMCEKSVLPTFPDRNEQYDTELNE